MSKTTIVLDSQELTTFERCPKAYDYAFNHMLERWNYSFRHVEDKTFKIEGVSGKSKALNKGGVMAKAIETYYQLGIDGADMLTRIVEGAKVINAGEFVDTPSETAVEQRMLCLTSYADYVTYYAKETFKPIAVEQGFSKTLYDSDDLRIIYEGRPDLVGQMEENSPIIPVDNKTEAKENELHGYNNQFMGYCWALGVDTFVVNYIGLQKNKSKEDKFRRSYIQFTKRNFDTWINNTIYWVNQLWLSRQNNYWPLNRAGCDGKYGVCIFEHLCDAPDEWSHDQRKGSLYKIKDSKWSAWK